jgi:hypothetical protein
MQAFETTESIGSKSLVHRPARRPSRHCRGRLAQGCPAVAEPQNSLRRAARPAYSSATSSDSSIARQGPRSRACISSHCIPRTSR